MVGKLLKICRPVRFRGRPGLVWRGLEALEQRQLLSVVYPTDAEQYLIQVINQERNDPAGAIAMDNVKNFTDINEGPPTNQAGQIVTLTTDPKQPLAVNLYLTDAAVEHTQWMSDTLLFSHYETTNGEIDGPVIDPHLYMPQDRDITAGFNTPGGLAGFENIAWFAPEFKNPPSVADADTLNVNLFADLDEPGRGHRINLMNPDLTEIGVGLQTASATSDGRTYNNAAMVTEDFSSGGGPFLTGVVYVDTDHNNFYTPGEEMGEPITITATSKTNGAQFTTQTWAAGGYSLKVPNDTYDISATGPGIAEEDIGPVTVSGINVEEDFVEPAKPAFPAIAVQGGTHAIANGDTTPATADGTEFGAAAIAAAPVAHTFTIKDTGAAALNLTGTPVVSITGADAGDFTVVAQPSSAVSAGGSEIFQVQFQPTGLGLRTAAVTIASDDPSQASFTFDIEGTGAAPDLIGQFVGLTTPAATLVPGDKVKAVVKVINKGDLATKSPASVTLYASTDQSLDTGVDPALATLSVPASLAANGGSKSVTFNITVGNANPGSYFLLADVDSGMQITESDEDNNVAASNTSTPIVWQFGNVGTRKNVKLVLHDSDGTIDTFALTGNGTGTVISTNGVPGDVTIDNSDATTAVSITTKKSKTPGDDGLTSIHNLVINGSAKSFIAKTTNVDGNISVTGTIATLQANDFTDSQTPHNVNIGGVVKPTDTTTLTFHLLDDVVLHSLTPLKTLTVADAMLGSVVTTTGNIGTATIGAMEDSTLYAGVTAGTSGLPTSDLLGAATIGTLTIKGVADHPNGSFENSFVAAGTINSATIHDAETSNNDILFGFVAKHIKKIKRLDAPKSIVLPSGPGDADTNPNDDFVIQIVA